MKAKAAFLVLLSGWCAAAASADGYFTAAIVDPYIDWDCAAILCDETPPTVLSLGYGWPTSNGVLFVEAEGLLTLSEGQVEGADYRVDGIGGYGVFRTRGATFFTARAGVTCMHIDGPGSQRATGSAMSPAAGIGFGFARRFVIELRMQGDDMTSLNLTWLFR